MSSRKADDYTSQVCAPPLATTSAKSLDESAGDQSEDIINLKRGDIIIVKI
jgi:hypothetical protein